MTDNETSPMTGKQCGR